MNTRWVKFTDDFNWRPPERVTTTIAYKAGSTHYVRKQAAEEAVAAGKARLLTDEEVDGRRQRSS